ncbi:hypothetical protein BaOVIS_023940 [Babesia ovis]|uniref:Uncharacterized protein n=1 Tax=Babesia ovis TaxID=5869 RepID=A0A9W5WVF1_BABOV|nr:hypothetical protein BaOVIS_023940 [Babesia ovis]
MFSSDALGFLEARFLDSLGFMCFVLKLFSNLALRVPCSLPRLDFLSKLTTPSVPLEESFGSGLLLDVLPVLFEDPFLGFCDLVSVEDLCDFLNGFDLGPEVFPMEPLA